MNQCIRQTFHVCHIVERPGPISKRYDRELSIQTETPSQLSVLGVFRHLSHTCGRGRIVALAKLSQRSLENRAEAQRGIFLRFCQGSHALGSVYRRLVIASEPGVVALHPM